MKRFVIFILLSVFLALGGMKAQEIIRKNEVLSLERCIDIALKNHPDIMAAIGTAEAGRSRIRQAQAGYYPQIDWISSAGRSSVGSRRSLGFTTGSVTYNSYSTGIALNQMIVDFGKTAAEVKIQKLDYNASLSDLEKTSELVIFNVKQAYYGVLQAKHNKEIMAQTVNQFEAHLEQAKGFYDVGTKPKFDVTKAEVDLSNAKLNLIKAKNAVRLAMADLNAAMGVTASPEYDIEDNLAFEKYIITFEEALSTAYENRPDLKSIVAKRQAADSSIALAKKGFYPVLSGTAGYNYGGNVFPLERGWEIGLNLSVSLFSGFLTKSQVEEARANLKVLQANEESLRQAAYLDVQAAYLNLIEAEELIPAAKLTVEQAQENFDIVGGSYAEGLADPIQVTDANVALSNAKTSYIQALYDYRIARASLEKAMGLR